MSIKRFVLLFISHVPTLIWAQASYMHEAQEDSGNPITGLFGLILLGGLLYFILHIKELYDKQKETIKRNKIKLELEAKINREMVKWEEEQRKAAKPIAVDLGLSVLWAKYNLGAYKANDIGDYYRWAETHLPRTDNIYDYKNINLNEIGNIEGNPNYDVASKLLGEDWRMPTPNECKELLELCSWEVQIIDGVEGRKIIGPNGNSIFLPFNSMNYIIKKITSGHYWTSSPKEGWKNYAQDLRFGENCKIPAEIWCADGRQKYNIRPVRNK